MAAALLMLAAWPATAQESDAGQGEPTAEPSAPAAASASAPDAGAVNAAYELARSRLIAGQRDSAFEPANRAVELYGEGGEAFPNPDLVRLAATMAAFDPAEADFEDIRILALTITEAEKTAPPGDALVVAGWMDVARAHRERGRRLDADAAITQSLIVMRNGDSAPAPLQMEVLNLAGDTTTSLGRYDEAARHFWEAARLYAQTGSGDEDFLSEWAELATRSAAAAAAHETATREALPFAPIQLPGEIADAPCAPDWRRQKRARLHERPKFDRAGAAMVVMELTPEGETRNAEILATVPHQRQFADAALEAVAEWEARPDSLAETCPSMRHVTIVKVIERR